MLLSHSQRPLHWHHRISVLVCGVTMAISGTSPVPLCAQTPGGETSPSEVSPETTKGGKETEKQSQYNKNNSPSGMQIGTVAPEAAASLPQQAQEYAKAGALASSEQNWKAAREAYQKMVAILPNNALALSNLGIVEYRLGQYDSARDCIRKALSLNPAIAQNWLTLGLIYLNMRELDLALAALARAVHEDPRDPRIHLYMAVVVREYGWPGAAQEELLRAIKLDPDYADAHFNLSLLYLEQDPPLLEMARRHYFLATQKGAKPDLEVEKRLAQLAAEAEKGAATPGKAASATKTPATTP
ncbi:MAG: tetratricopeptide repeat protein [Verrucomicrobiales bacterium]|nr:tetratricopeptide repeat protein [Akkermansiaceae bacterium]